MAKLEAVKAEAQTKTTTKAPEGRWFRVAKGKPPYGHLYVVEALRLWGGVAEVTCVSAEDVYHLAEGKLLTLLREDYR